jgi:membrane protein implicated in regulation of membrane protease activity
MQIRLTFFDVVLFAIMIIGFVIGIHQSIYYGVANSYWLFMLSSLAFLWLNQRMRNKKEEMEKNPQNQTGKNKESKAKPGKRR